MANERRLIDAEDFIKTFWQRVHDGEIVTLMDAEHAIINAPTVVAFTEDQLSTILKAADGLETRNQKLETELVRLKNCLNCKIRKKCPRHCGKVVHGCDHWEYGDSTADSVEVVHGRWLTLEEYAEKIGADPTGYTGGWRFCSECEQPMRELYGWAYCPNCGAKMDGDGNA